MGCFCLMEESNKERDVDSMREGSRCETKGKLGWEV